MITISTTNFLSAIKSAKAILSKRSSRLIASDICLKFNSNKIIEVYSCNDECCMSFICEADECDVTEVCIVDAESLFRAVSSLDGICNIDIDPHILTVSDDILSISISIDEFESYPSMFADDFDTDFAISFDELCNIWNVTKNSVSKNDARIALTGINFKISTDGVITAASTNSHALVKYQPNNHVEIFKHDTDTKCDKDVDFTIPEKHLATICKSFSGEPILNISVRKNMIKVKGNNIEGMFSLLLADYVNYERIINNKPITVSLIIKDLLKACNDCNIQATPTMHLYNKDGALYAYTQSNLCRVTEKIDCHFNEYADFTSFYINPVLLKSVLLGLDDSNLIKIEADGATKSVNVICNDVVGNATIVIMPLNITNEHEEGER